VRAAVGLLRGALRGGVSWYKHVSEYVHLRGSPWQEDPLLGLLQETISEAHLGLLSSGAVHPPLKALLRLLSFFLWHVRVYILLLLCDLAGVLAF
jgi:hypothetical protein